MNDQQLHEHIEQLVAEEHGLLEQAGAISETERTRLGAINVQLDRLWDLLRQRRAREEFGQVNPSVQNQHQVRTIHAK